MKTEEEIWIEFCKKIKEKLKEITEPVASNSSNRSYNALVDVITNVILLEINIDRKPWEEISKTVVRLPTIDEHIKNAEWMANPRQVANILLEKLKGNLSYHDVSIESLNPQTLKEFALYSALKDYLLVKSDD